MIFERKISDFNFQGIGSNGEALLVNSTGVEGDVSGEGLFIQLSVLKYVPYVQHDILLAIMDPGVQAVAIK